MLCGDVRRVVYFFLDGQLGEKKQQDVSSHLNLCPECEQRTAISRRLRSFVQRRLNNLETPSHLKQRLERSIRAFRTEWSSSQ
jgi:mycothiol system anti-sigma-R factor